ncbi:MAG: hypothetical protein LBV28_02275, partial [Puniceicoccales bacterium]|nr:hypothetical protein [Puniceicoccales bacterium]
MKQPNNTGSTTRKRLLAMFFASAAITIATPARADDTELSILRKQVEEQAAKIEKLEKRQVMTDADETKAIATTPKTSFDTKGFNVALPD